MIKGGNALGFRKKFMSMFGDDYEDEQEQEEIEKNKPIKDNKKQQEDAQNIETDKKVVPMSMFRNKKEEGVRNKVSSVSIIRPKTFDDSRLIANSIKDKKVVNFSLEFLEHEAGQRVIDFVSGAAYAMNAQLSKVTDKVFTSTPNGIEVEDRDDSLYNENEL